MEPVDFVKMVWDEQNATGFVFVSVKQDTWYDVAFSWKKNKGGEVEIPNVDGDLYFCPNVFSGPKRRKELMLPSIWLYADLDDVDPEYVDPRPTTAWESSPNRFQCLWRMTQKCQPQEHSELNQRLTYAIGADKGGWDRTQVLRIPGTINHKYPLRPKVKLLWT